MAFKKDDYGDFNYDIDTSIDEVIEESPNSFTALRKVSWNGKPAKLDLRRWYLSSSGEEHVGKGISINDESGHRLVAALMEHGFGETGDIISSIKDRDDFDAQMRSNLTDEDLDRIKNTEVPKDLLDPEYYDPRAIFMDGSDIKVEDGE